MEDSFDLIKVAWEEVPKVQGGDYFGYPHLPSKPFYLPGRLWRKCKTRNSVPLSFAIVTLV